MHCPAHVFNLCERKHSLYVSKQFNEIVFPLQYDRVTLLIKHCSALSYTDQRSKRKCANMLSQKQIKDLEKQNNRINSI
jgi:hypothetical protein